MELTEASVAKYLDWPEHRKEMEPTERIVDEDTYVQVYAWFHGQYCHVMPMPVSRGDILTLDGEYVVDVKCKRPINYPKSKRWGNGVRNKR
jgi:hypothetical protein